MLKYVSTKQARYIFALDRQRCHFCGFSKEELRRRRHEPVAILGGWLRSVVRGYFNYHAVPGNIFPLGAFRTEVIRSWYRSLKRRSQRSKITWDRFGKVANMWIPQARILHPYPEERFYA